MKGETIKSWYSDNSRAGGMFRLTLRGLNHCKLLCEFILVGGEVVPVCWQQNLCMCPRGVCVTHLTGGSY